jgi:hypothetical protein
MSRTVRSVALTAVLLHMTLGCCLHHAHATARQDCGEGTLLETARGGDCHGPHSRPEPCQRQPRHRLCDNARCVFTRPEPTDLFALLIVQQGLAPSGVVLGHPRLAGIARVEPSVSHLGPPLRLHLLNQALLL